MIVMYDDNVPKIFYPTCFVADSLGFCINSKSAVLKSNLCFWEIKNRKNCFIAGWGDMRAIDIIKYEDNLLGNKVIDYDYLCNVVCSKISKILYRENFIKNQSSGWGTEFIVIDDNNIFSLSSGMVRRIENYQVLGDYANVLNTILYNTKKQGAHKVIEAINDSFAKLYQYALYPFILLDTKTKEISLVDNGNISKMNISLNNEVYK